MGTKTTSKAATKSGITTKSRVKAGRIVSNHNQAVGGLRVKSGVKAGAPSMSEIVVTKDLDCASTS